jgi:hypothetical protein
VASRGDASRFAHPGFKDETGNVYGLLRVVRRAANVNGNARWLCICGGCGGQATVEGIALRSGKTTHCSNCRPKRLGTVRRKPTD